MQMQWQESAATPRSARLLRIDNHVSHLLIHLQRTVGIARNRRRQNLAEQRKKRARVFLGLPHEIRLPAGTIERAKDHLPQGSGDFVRRAFLPPACLGCARSSHLYFPLFWSLGSTWPAGG